jgi:hypothetical protein
MVLMTGDGALLPSGAQASLNFRAVLAQFRRPELRRAACGYLGHMWELYAFWALAPLFCEVALRLAQLPTGYVPLWSFFCIAAGSAGCVGGGMLSTRLGSARVASYGMAGSALMCTTVPLLRSGPLLLACLVAWGVTVIADSPQLSTLAFEGADRRSVASALAILNGCGFALSAVSIQLCTAMWPAWGPAVAVLLLPGPCLGFAALRWRR